MILAKGAVRLMYPRSRLFVIPMFSPSVYLYVFVPLIRCATKLKTATDEMNITRL